MYLGCSHDKLVPPRSSGVPCECGLQQRHVSSVVRLAGREEHTLHLTCQPLTSVQAAGEVLKQGYSAAERAGGFARDVRCPILSLQSGMLELAACCTSLLYP